MQHYRSLEEVHLRDTWLTIGAFDGVHLGHQAIVRQLTTGAHAQGAQAVVLTFHPHPAVVLGKRPSANYLTTPSERVALLGEMGIDVVITHPFNAQVAARSANEFLSLLQAHLGFRQLFVGHDFAMGHNREGDVPALRRLAEAMDFGLQVFPAVQVAGQLVSSSAIRALLAAGQVTEANRLLGRPYAMSGRVVPGDGRGKTLGIPTANLEVDSQRLVPGTGVYVCLAQTQNGVWGAVANIGVRPTFEDHGDTPMTVEAHLLNFDGDLYGQTLRLMFLERVRGEKRFPNPEALVNQIHADIRQARQILAMQPTPP